MNDFQFYPTPPDLVRRAWAIFKNRNFIRVLEPHGGNGDLAMGHPHNTERRYKEDLMLDVCEIDVTKHAVLRSKKLNVVGNDFLKFTSGAIYSHIVMNPPFATGATHVLKAWDILWNGEISAYINADTIRNPYSKERQILVQLIKQYGEVEFIEGAFAVPEAERKTTVDVALVYLKKTADVNDEIYGDLFADMRQDETTKEDMAGDYNAPQEVALSNSAIENMVIAFKAAMISTRDAVHAEARARYYSAILGDTLAVRNGDGATTKRDDVSVDFVQNEIYKRYLELQDRAWSGVLRSSKVTSRLSSAAQRRVESEFENLKKLEFTVENIYGFLCGIMENRGSIQIGMVCDVFDLITRWHTDNLSLYKGWKSNDKHRTCGMSIKTTRFILPGHSCFGRHMDYKSMQLLKDFDAVFSLLDGKAEPEFSLVNMFEKQLNDLRAGKRVEGSYFSCRFYPQAGTIHFFPTRKDLIRRLNILVGRKRQWIPPADAPVSDSFWLNFDNAEKFDKELRGEIDKLVKTTHTSSRWDHPLHHLCRDPDDDRAAAALATIDEAITTVLERHGINIDFLIEGTQPERLLLAA